LTIVKTSAANLKTLQARATVDIRRQESSGVLPPRPRIFSEAEAPATTSTPETETETDDQQEHQANTKANDREEMKTRANFREKIEKFIEEGQASNQQDKARPKSASSSVTKTSMEDFDKQSSSQVLTFFNNYADVDRGYRDVAPSASAFDKKYGANKVDKNNGGNKSDKYSGNKSVKSGSLALSSRGGHEHDEDGAGGNGNGYGDGTGRGGGYYNKTDHQSPYIDDISTEPHLVRGKLFIDHGDRDKRRFGNVRFSDQVFNRRPRSGHFPSKHDSLQGKHQYELWDSKRNKALQNQNHHQNHQSLSQSQDSVHVRLHTVTRSKSPLRNKY
jgi:hypothetical protein